MRFRAPGHFCICPVDKIHNFSTFEFSTRFQHRRAREILLKIYKKFNYFSVFVK
nr:MAG TPA: Kinase C Interacting protein-like protein [Caudoviricetes sp.]